MRAGLTIYALAAIATGIVDLLWGAFQSAEEPIQAFGDHVPGSHVFAYVIGGWLVLAGAAILWRRTARFGALSLAIIYGIFAAFSLPRLYTAPHFLGLRFSVFPGVLDGIFQQLILVAAAAIVYASLAAPGSRSAQRATVAARWIFGIGCIDFGLAHLTGIAATARLVPAWMPLGQDVWVVFTAAAFVLAGIAILVRFLDVPAARLLALMLLIFSALTLAPLIGAYPHAQNAWGMNAYNLAAVAAAWIFARRLATAA